MTDVEILMDLYDCDISQAYKHLNDDDSPLILGVYKRGYEKGLANQKKNYDYDDDWGPRVGGMND